MKLQRWLACPVCCCGILEPVGDVTPAECELMYYQNSEL